SYSLGGLPAGTSFRLVTWNGTVPAALSEADVVHSDARGIARLSAPRHAVWALTTLPVDLTRVVNET
ncbi:MAG TPA: hypothetical protein VI006_24495, partial [Solirubrobacteraceae bacterium]